MKNLCLCLILLSFFTSCEMDNNSFKVVELQTNSIDHLNSVRRLANDTIANSTNPFDYSGQLFSEILEIYYANHTDMVDSGVLVLEVEKITQSIPAFESIRPTFYQMASAEQVDYFVSQKNTCMTSVLHRSGMTALAKTSLLGFITQYVRLCTQEEQYSTLYNFIVNYETSVINHSDFTETDRKVLLVTTSIARYSAAVPKKKPKKNTDPAWEFLICTLYGSIDGANRSPAEAITLAVSSGIAENQ